MKLYPKKAKGKYVTSYFASLGSQEARDCDMINEDMSSRPIKKTVDLKHKRIIFELDREAWEAEQKGRG